MTARDSTDSRGSAPIPSRYTGPQDDAHLSAWQELRRQMSGGLDNGTYILPHMNLLDALAFSDRPLGDIVGQIPGGAAGYRLAKQAVESIMKECSAQQIKNKGFRPLHRSLVDGLVAKWIAYRDGCIKKDGGAAEDAMALFKAPEGSFISGILRMSQNDTVNISITRVCQRLKADPTTILHEKIEERAEQLFARSLMTYATDRGGHFNSFALGALQRFLFREAINIQHSERDPSHAARQLDPNLVDALASGAVGSVLDNDERDVMLKKLQVALRSLPEQDRKLAEDLFGLDGKPSKMQKEVAEEKGITKQAVVYQRNRLLRLLQKALTSHGVER